jgi:cytochrome c551/c552
MVETKPEVIAQSDLNDGTIKKETRLSKIWQQLKRAKNGENVNWSEVGIKPQKMLARADAKIENVLTKGEGNEK